MIIIKQIKITNGANYQIDFKHATQLYTMGNHVIIVYEETPLVFKTAKFPIKTLSKMEVEF